MTEGLSAKTAIAGNGRYREHAGFELLTLATCTWRGYEIVTLGERPQVLFAPTLPASYRVDQCRRSWTGRALDYRWKGGDLTLELRTSLPGPLLRTGGDSIALHAASGSEWRSFEELRSGTATSHLLDADAKGGRLWFVDSKPMPLVVAASRPVQRIENTSHGHYRFVFDRPSASLLVVPLLCADDAPRDAERQKLWLELAMRPPLAAEETFTERGDRLRITSRYPGSRIAPLPWFLSLLGERDGLVCFPGEGGPGESTTLLRTICGPYAVQRGNRWQVDVAMGWSRAQPTATRAVSGELSAIPEELVYAGDATWEPGTCMDQLMALRGWAPIVAQCPEPQRAELIRQLRVPSAKELRAAVEIIAEPTTGIRWGRWRSMWAHNGDACYDPDWYNGFGLSGLARACESGVPELAGPATKLAATCRTQRAALVDYFAIFHDWALCSAWSDPRGWMWNADCGHNGQEGILAEARLRAAEGDRSGAAWCRYLAGRTAIGLRAALELPAWFEALTRDAIPAALDMGQRKMVTWCPTKGIPERDDAPAIGVQSMDPFRRITWCTPATRNPYVLAGTNWHWNALLRDHVDRKRLRAITRWWAQEEPTRYADWMRYYCGDDWQTRRATGDQEAREQAAVFYSVAPEIAFRLWALGEDPRTIEARWQQPLGLAEQLFLRSGMRLGDA